MQRCSANEGPRGSTDFLLEIRKGKKQAGTRVETDLMVGGCGKRPQMSWVSWALQALREFHELHRWGKAECRAPCGAGKASSPST